VNQDNVKGNAKRRSQPRSRARGLLGGDRYGSGGPYLLVSLIILSSHWSKAKLDAMTQGPSTRN
jgi:hypothetical protein